MARRLTYNVLTGSDERLGLSFYYSPHFEQNIIRHGFSLTGARIKKDPAFKGFRESSSRMKQASPIAASLYKLLPAKIREYSLYRTLTGEAIKMLKEGAEAPIITETLKKKYIDPLLDGPLDLLPDRRVPLLNAPKRSSVSRSAEEPETSDRVKGLRHFRRYPAGPSKVRSIRSRRRSSVLQEMRAEQPMAQHLPSSDTDPLLQTEIQTAESSNGLKEPGSQPFRRRKTTDDLIYLGRLAECKKIKMWLRSWIVEV